MSADRHTVQLRHELPDGTWHIDWMIDVQRSERGPLVTFAAGGRVDRVEAGGELEVRRIADHRRRYLDYEGPISDGRGSVRRVAEGWIDALQSLGEDWAMLVRWRTPEDGRCRVQRLRIRRRHADRWMVQALS